MSGALNPDTTAPIEQQPTETKPAETAPATPPNLLADDLSKKPDDAAKPAEKPAEDGKKDEKKVEGAPESYADFTLPEGVTLDKEGLDAYKALAKEANLPQAVAQKFVDAHVAALKQASDQAYQLWVDTNKQWQDEVNKDPVIGGAHLPEVKSTIAKALQQYGDPKVRDALIATGAGNNPAIIRTFYNMAKRLTEGGMVTGRPAGQKPASMAQAIYPDLPSGG